MVKTGSVIAPSLARTGSRTDRPIDAHMLACPPVSRL